jgi:hypothetical protein
MGASMSCNDSCAVDKAEAKEFAYFSGLTKGAQIERERIIKIIRQLQDEAYQARTGLDDNGVYILENALWKIEGITE